ncbi:putative RNA-directed DNA polymerase from transposon X-element [Penaeus vannamei]|uniref:Putative RNA-directed DNA polymerase from transposon X-element n=1 Tax=Penaeus vannamei TaxID=6689 RepID=A0A423SXU8_PENVA|nr:putative RNA-directed DNA polymerase from transposon X-element [Penaeus vannamei]
MIRKLRHIFNACLATGYFPDKFKHATITLIAKSGKSAHEVGITAPSRCWKFPGNCWRGLLPADSSPTLKTTTTQQGTESAIALAYEEIALGLANKHQINIILRDVSKAFDKVWHDGLKYKIIQLQLPTHLTRLLCSFLDHRTATIRLGSHLGTPLHLRSGVPQGSVLSPTLYILYTANLPQPTPHSNYFSYADDVTQIISHPSKSQHIMKLTTQRAIQNINTLSTIGKYRLT